MSFRPTYGIESPDLNRSLQWAGEMMLRRRQQADAEATNAVLRMHNQALMDAMALKLKSDQTAYTRANTPLGQTYEQPLPSDTQRPLTQQQAGNFWEQVGHPEWASQTPTELSQRLGLINTAEGMKPLGIRGFENYQQSDLKSIAPIIKEIMAGQRSHEAAGARMYAADQGLAGRKYAADKTRSSGPKFNRDAQTSKVATEMYRAWMAKQPGLLGPYIQGGANPELNNLKTQVWDKLGTGILGTPKVPYLPSALHDLAVSTNPTGAKVVVDAFDDIVNQVLHNTNSIQGRRHRNAARSVIHGMLRTAQLPPDLENMLKQRLEQKIQEAQSGGSTVAPGGGQQDNSIPSATPTSVTPEQLRQGSTYQSMMQKYGKKSGAVNAK
jgi:hypothetical protein